MSLASELFSQAMSHYKAGEYTQAEKYFAMAAQAAAENEDWIFQHESLVWQVASLSLNSQYKQAMSIAFEALLLESSYQQSWESFASWLLRKKIFECTCHVADEYTKIESKLADLLSYANTHAVPKHDPEVIQADWFRDRGDFKQALQHYERANLLHEDSYGYLKCGYADSASLCAMHLKQFDTAIDWINLIDNTAERQQGFINYILINQAFVKFTLARTQGQAFTQLKSLHMDIDNINPYLDEGKTSRREAQFYLALLNPDGGDPNHKAHPSRRLLLWSHTIIEQRFEVFYYLILVLDYRLACLRYIAGLPPHDDEWREFVKPDAINIEDKVEFARRLKKVQTVATSTIKRAKLLDKILQCSYRTEKTQKRINAINAIAELAQC